MAVQKLGCVLAVLGVIGLAPEVFGGDNNSTASFDAISRALTHLPKRPTLVAVIDAQAAKPGVREALLRLDGFTLRVEGGTMDPHRVVYLVKQSGVLREAAMGSRFFEYVLASVIWHEMAHLDGADERGARSAEQELWTVFVRDGFLDPIAALRYLSALAARPDDQLSTSGGSPAISSAAASRPSWAGAPQHFVGRDGDL